MASFSLQRMSQTMRYYLLILLVAVLSGCRKGKKLPEVVYVHYDGVSSVGIWPQGPFDPIDPFDSYEPVHYPSYVFVSDADYLADGFDKDLAAYLKKNNVILTSDPAEYTLTITNLSVTESLSYASYTDSCSWDYSTAYVYYSKLHSTVNATLTRNGGYVGSWERNGFSEERVRDKRGSCNEPYIGNIKRDPRDLVGQMARELRVKIANKLYDLEAK